MQKTDVVAFVAVVIGRDRHFPIQSLCWGFYLERARIRATAKPAIEQDRLERIEQAVDAIALEVERISESQRFVTKLLAERGKDALPR